MFDQSFWDYMRQLKEPGQEQLEPLQPFQAPPGTSFMPPSVEPPKSTMPPAPPFDPDAWNRRKVPPGGTSPYANPSEPWQGASMGGGMPMGLGPVGGGGGGGGGLLSGLFGGGGGAQATGGKPWGPMLMALGGGIAGGASQGWGAGIGSGLQGAAAIRQRQDVLNQQEQQEKARLAQQMQIAQMRDERPSSVQEFEYAKKNGFTGTYSEFLNAGGSGGMGLDIYYGRKVGPDGKETIVPMQASRGGGLASAAMPEGVSILPPEEQAGLTAGKKASGKDRGEAEALYESMNSKLPELNQSMNELNALADKMTYTTAGKLYDEGRRQLDMEPREGAVARTAFIAKVDQVILPTLRDTFGAQFTVTEGQWLRNTLADPDSTPQEKKEVLKSFVDQKVREITSLARRTGQQAPTQAAPSGTNKTKHGVTWGFE
jgi:hypothetical protein